MVKIAPSTDPAKNFDDLLSYINEIRFAAHFLHVDVMNSNFVQKTNFDENFVAKINANTAMMLDVHLMVNEPDVLKYIEAGANIVTVHYEAFENKNKLKNALKLIREHKALAGLSIKPNPSVEEIASFLDYVDLVLVMSVEPGSSGQKFMEETYNKVSLLKDYIGKRPIQIEVDGGIVPEIAKNLKKCGADILVSGSYVYSSKDRVLAIKELMQN
mgnify:FL=1